MTTSPLDALSPTALLQLRNTQTPTSTQRAVFRGRIRAQVKSCTDCALRSDLPSRQLPTPFHGPTSASFVVVGEAPGPEESAAGQPFVGKSGKLLRALMRDVGIDDEDDVLWCNTVSCFPNVEGKVAMPSDSATMFCRDNLIDQIETAYVPHVLLVGARALHAFRSDLQVTHHHGKLFVWNDLYAVMAIPHPAAVLRGQRQFKKIIHDDLVRWAEIVYGGDDPLAYLETACVRCGGAFFTYDRDGVAYCRDHFERYKDQWLKERRRWTDAKIEKLGLPI